MTADERNRLIAEKIGAKGRECGPTLLCFAQWGLDDGCKTCPDFIPLDFGTLGAFMTVLWPWFVQQPAPNGPCPLLRAQGKAHRFVLDETRTGTIHLHLPEARDLIADAIAEGEGS